MSAAEQTVLARQAWQADREVILTKNFPFSIFTTLPSCLISECWPIDFYFLAE
jgi:hypothetical protein